MDISIIPWILVHYQGYQHSTGDINIKPELYLGYHHTVDIIILPGISASYWRHRYHTVDTNILQWISASYRRYQHPNRDFSNLPVQTTSQRLSHCQINYKNRNFPTTLSVAEFVPCGGGDGWRAVEE